MRKFIVMAALLIGQAAYANCTGADCPPPNADSPQTAAHKAPKARSTTNAAPINYAQILSVFTTSQGNYLVIPQLAVPNAKGSFDIFAVLLQLVNVNPLQFQLVEIQPVANPVNAMSAAFSPEAQLLFIPVMAAELGNNVIVPVFETMLKLTSLQPVLLTEYLPIQATQPTSQTSAVMADPTSYQMLSDMSRRMHDTNMSILSNMDGTSCYGYDYQCN